MVNLGGSINPPYPLSSPGSGHGSKGLRTRTFSLNYWPTGLPVRLWLNTGISPEFTAEPSTGQPDVVPDSLGGAVQYGPNFFRGHPAEVMHFDDLGQRSLLLRQRVQRTVDIDDLKLTETPSHQFDAGIPRNP